MERMSSTLVIWFHFASGLREIVEAALRERDNRVEKKNLLQSAKCITIAIVIIVIVVLRIFE